MVRHIKVGHFDKRATASFVTLSITGNLNWHLHVFVYKLFFQINQIRALEESLAVKITIVNNQREVFIRIQGMPADTTQASLQIVNIFRQMEQDDKDKALASVYAKQVCENSDVLFNIKCLNTADWSPKSSNSK